MTKDELVVLITNTVRMNTYMEERIGSKFGAQIATRIDDWVNERLNKMELRKYCIEHSNNIEEAKELENYLMEVFK